MMQKGHQQVLCTPPAEKRMSAEKPEGVKKYAVKDRWGFLVQLCATLKEAQELARELREDRP